MATTSASGTTAGGSAPAAKSDSAAGAVSPSAPTDAAAAKLASTSLPVPKLSSPSQTSRTVGAIASNVVDGGGLNYWIELYRSGKSYRCNNKTKFQSGDSIRFHVIPQAAGYGYVLMKESSTGKKSVLFPTKQTGSDNFLAQGKDYVLPNKTWLEFDNHPGIERLTLVFSKTKIADPTKAEGTLTAYVSPTESGSKDLVPTRCNFPGTIQLR